MASVERLQRRIKAKQENIHDLEVRLHANKVALHELETKLARAKAERWGRFMAQHEPTIHYTQARPTTQYDPGTTTMYLDCSGMCETVARWSGLKDPSGLGWGNGNTDSMLRTLKTIGRKQIQPGDYAIWHNGSDGLHVALIVGVSRNDVTISSHGQESGPALYQLSNYSHEGTLSFLSATE